MLYEKTFFQVRDKKSVHLINNFEKSETFLFEIEFVEEKKHEK